MPRDACLKAEIKFAEMDLSQYFGLWAIEPTRFLAAVEEIRRLDLHAHMREAKANRHTVVTTAERENEIALVKLSGTLMKQSSSLVESSSSVELRRQIRTAACDPSISGLAIVIDSPGGTVAGTSDLAKEVAAARKKKPVYAFIEDLGASAAYWVASQADKIVANDPTALIGSIGTFVGLYDISKAAEMEGVRAIVVTSGGVKGAGFPGAPIGEEVVRELQLIVDKTQEEFNAAIAKGRNKTTAEVRSIADGRLYMAADAVKAGLVDSIDSFEAMIADLSKQTSKRAKALGVQMAETEKTQQIINVEADAPYRASYDEIVTACPGAGSDFICDQLRAKVTAESASKAWVAELLRQRDAAVQMVKVTEKDRDQLKAIAPSRGIEALDTRDHGRERGAADSGDPVAEWNELIEAKVKAGMSRSRAAMALNRERPELREVMVEEWNDRQNQRSKKTAG